MFNLFKSVAFIPFLIALVENGAAQNIFQRNYSLNYSIREMRGIVHMNGKTNVIYSHGDCFTPLLDPLCGDIGFLELDSTESTKFSYKYYNLNHDTSYTPMFISKYESGKIHIIGANRNPTNDNSIVIELDSVGEFIRGIGYKFPGYNYFTKLKCKNENGPFFVLGIIDSIYTPYRELVVICKLDSNLSPIWSKIYPSQQDLHNPRILDFQLLDDGNIIACGNIRDSSASTGIGDLLLIKLDSLGEIIWTKKYTTYKYSKGYSIDVLSDGYLVAGLIADSINNDNAIFLMKVDTAGGIVWEKTYYSQCDGNTRMLRTSDNGYLLTSNNFYNFGSTQLIKVDSAGNVEWNKYYEKGRYGTDICEGENQCFYSLGRSDFSTMTSSDTTCIFIIKTDSTLTTGCFETTFPIVITTNSNYSINSFPISAIDYIPATYSFQLLRDTLLLNQIDICNNISEVDKNIISMKEWGIYPSPCSEKLYLSGPHVSIITYKIFNLSGMLIRQGSLSGSSQFIDVSKINNGIYIISINDRSFMKFNIIK